MQFAFVETELSYLIKRFNYHSIVGLNRCLYDEEQVKQSLLEKGYLIKFSCVEELANPVRILLSVWSRMRYSFIRSDCKGDDNSLFILVSEEAILFVSVFEHKVYVEMLDADEQKLNLLLYNYLQLNERIYDSQTLNITLTVDDFVELFFLGSQSNVECVEQKLGLSCDEISDLHLTMECQPHAVLIVQDLQMNIGSLNVIYSIKGKLVMIKHVTPPTKENERVVIVKGDLRAIVDSIYIL